MSEEKLCDACLELLSGDRDAEFGVHKRVGHHSDAESFRVALRLPCYLCCFVSKKWSDFTTSYDPELIEATITWFESGALGAGSTTRDWFTVGSLAFGGLVAGIYRHGCALKLESWESMSRYDFPGLLSPNTGSKKGLDFLLRKLKECDNDHIYCRVGDTSPVSYPSRLLRVGNLGDQYVSLRDTHKSIIEGPYFCLSHCWGKSQPLILTRQTAQSLEKGIPLNSLPKTLREAVIVTRTFQVQYLWIDSLCIYQDSLDDWTREASHMRTVYSHAACTIAATAASNGDEGLFFPRDPWLLRPRCLTTPRNSEVHGEPQMNYPPRQKYWCDDVKIWSAVDNAPLNRRGWVFQERHLSRRILHFAADQLFWECYQCKASENYPDGLPSWALRDSLSTSLKTQVHQLRLKNGSSRRDSDKIPPFNAPTADEIDDLYLNWIDWREEYSQGAFTKEEDRLIAIHGITQDIEDIAGDQLIFGMWKSRIMDELAFNFVGEGKSSPPRKPCGPSWSWISTNKKASSWGTRFLKSRPRTYLAELNGLHMDSSRTGTPGWATLRIQCNLVHAVATWGVWSARTASELRNPLSENPEDLPDSRLLKIRLALSGLVSNDKIFPLLDNPSVRSNDRSPEIYLLPLRHWHEFVEQNGVIRPEAAEFLLLVRRPIPENAFERIGYIFVFSGAALDGLLAEHAMSENRIITLV